MPGGNAPPSSSVVLLTCMNRLEAPRGIIIYSTIYNVEGAAMAVTSVDLDPQLLERARTLTGEKSNRAVLDLALRRLIASNQKGAMIDGIQELADLPEGLGAPVISYPDPES